MKKVFTFLISLIILTLSVNAAGSSTGNSNAPDYSCQSNSDCEIRSLYYCCGDNLEGINKCYNKNEPVQIIPTCSSSNPCPGFAGPEVTNCECINSVCTGSNTQSQDTTADSTTLDTSSDIKVDCEALNPENRRERIKCRFENKARLKTPGYDRVPEACRLNSERKEKCKQLYKKTAKCFELDNSNEKKTCFLKESGVNQGQLIRNTGSETKRNYLVILLYELQERIEEWEEDSLISKDDASTLIESIVEIKQDILNGETKQTIKPKIREFRKKFNELKPLNL